MDITSILPIIVLIALFVIGMGIIFIGMPGIFVIAGGYAAYGLLIGNINWTLFGFVAAIAVFAEIMDFVVGILGAKKFGTTKRGIIGAVLGMIAGAIIGTPIPIIGNIIGIFLGAFLGAYLLEYAASKDSQIAKKSAIGALLGKAAAIGLKSILGIICIVVIVMHISK